MNLLSVFDEPGQVLIGGDSSVATKRTGSFILHARSPCHLCSFWTGAWLVRIRIGLGWDGCSTVLLVGLGLVDPWFPLVVP